jgi:hypothetical protein
VRFRRRRQAPRDEHTLTFERLTNEGPGTGYPVSPRAGVRDATAGALASRRKEQSRTRASPFRGDSLVSGHGRGGRAGSPCRGCGTGCRMVWAARVRQRVGASV